MKVKVEAVITGRYEYDSAIVIINKQKTDIVFNKINNMKQYEGKIIDITNIDGKYIVGKVFTQGTKENSD